MVSPKLFYCYYIVYNIKITSSIFFDKNCIKNSSVRMDRTIFGGGCGMHMLRICPAWRPLRFAHGARLRTNHLQNSSLNCFALRCLPSRVRIPFHYFNQKKKHTLRCASFLAERVGFEPTDPCESTVFKTVPLWPLRYLSIPEYINTIIFICQYHFDV